MKLGVLALVGGAVLAMGSLTGCETLSQSPAENGNMVAHAVITDWRQIPEDTDMILLLDRPSWLNRKPMPWGYH